MKRITVIALVAVPLLGIIGGLGWKIRANENTIADLRNLSVIVAKCPLPPKDSDWSMIIWRATDAKTGEEELRCTHGRIRPADVRHGPPLPSRTPRSNAS